MDIKPQHMGTQERKTADTSTAAHWLEYRYADTAPAGGGGLSARV